MTATLRPQPTRTRVNKPHKAKHANGLSHAIRADWFLVVGLATTAVFLLGGEGLDALVASPIGAVMFIWLFAAMLGSALGVARHADRVAEILGEPYGTLVLTLSVTSIEVLSISAVMMHGDNNPTLVRDTLFAIVMIITGAMVGIALLAGGWRHREQSYNLQGANAYLGVIIPMAMLTLSLPEFTVTAEQTLPVTQQVFIFIMSVGLYGAFLTIQTGRHRGFFATGEEGDGHPDSGGHSLARHSTLLLAYMVPVVFLAEELAGPIDYLIETVRMPGALGGVIIALLVATPEAIAATRAALANRVQRAINISLGSVLSTIGLTVPTMLAISYAVHREVHLGLSGGNNLLLALTLAVSVVTFASGRTNILQGVVHLVLFAAFFMLIFQS